MAAGACPGEGPINVLVPYAPGGSVDVTARIVARAVSQRLRRPLVVVNVPGASGVIAVRQLLAAPRDGCTLFGGSINTVVLAPLQNPRAGYTPGDLQPVGRIGATSLLLTASLASGLRDLATLQQAVRAGRPLRAGHPGTDSVQALALGLLEARLQTRFVQVPYGGAGPMTGDLVGGHIDLAAMTQPAALPLLRRGVLALVEVPVAPGDGLPSLWNGWFVARGVAPAALVPLQQAMAAVLAEAPVVEALTALGVDVESRDAAALAAEVASTAGRVQQLLAARRPASSAERP
jgi:tripartite-type tricarboxylate transporter receptor subunit TctC